MLRPGPPSAGGPGNGLSDVVHLAEKVGITIPDGDTDKLKGAGDAWDAVSKAPAFGGLADEIGRIINSVSLVHSPEADTVIADLKNMQEAAQTLFELCGGLAADCYDHKIALGYLRSKLEKQLEELAEEILKEIGIGLAITVVTSMVTFGIGALIEAARVARIVERFAGPIADMVNGWKKARDFKKVITGAENAKKKAKDIEELEQRVGRAEEEAPKPPVKDSHQGIFNTRPAGWTDADEAAIKDYTGSGHKELNEALRSGKPLTTDQQARVDAINAALAKCPSHQGWVVRGTKMPKEVLDQYQEGATVTEKGFTSSSRTADGAFTGGENDVEMHILSKSGKDVSNISLAGQHEEEVLFGDHMPVKVTNRVQVGNRVILTVEEQ